jgi:NAD(P)H dehydrogenase (quinone)
MDINSLLVFGARGVQGHPVVDAALEAGLVVRAASRDVEAAEEKLSTRAEIVEADLGDADSIFEAAEGIDALFFHLPILPEGLIGADVVDNVIAAAVRSGVQRLIFSTGEYCGDELPEGEFVTSMRDITRRLLECPVDAVVLRPTLYLANLVWPHVIREVRDQGRLTYPPFSEKRRLNWTSTEDQGRIVVACLEADVAGQVIDIASPEPVTGPELCRHLSRVWNREVHFAPQSNDDFADMLSHLTGSARVARAISGLYADIEKQDKHGPLVDTDALQQRLGIELTPVSEWVDDRLGTLIELYG